MSGKRTDDARVEEIRDWPDVIPKLHGDRCSCKECILTGLVNVVRDDLKSQRARADAAEAELVNYRAYPAPWDKYGVADLQARRARGHEIRRELEAWKAEAMAAEDSWDAQAVGTELDLACGASIRPAILPELVRRRERITKLEEWAKHLRGCDGRTPPPIAGYDKGECHHPAHREPL